MMQSITYFQVFNLGVSAFFVVLSLFFFYQSWMNLYQHKWAEFSWDNLAFSFSSLVRGKKYATNAKKSITTDAKQLHRYGRLAFIRGMVSIGIAVFWFIRFLS
jgi:divalent metal cation (Fe/Co/Zn/Cd) transporter